MVKSKEYTEITTQPPTGIHVVMDEADVHKWHIVLDGPEGSPYAVSLALLPIQRYF
jgi:ubiquitin-protein ligase